MDATQEKEARRVGRKPKAESVQTSIRLPKEFVAQVDEYRWTKRKPTFAKALIELAQIGLQSNFTSAQ